MFIKGCRYDFYVNIFFIIKKNSTYLLDESFFKIEWFK